MNKSNAATRKRALEYVKKREWDKAIGEFLKLAESEKHNPNVFNELGDLYLKIGDKSRAFTAFHTAVDAYSRNTLYNNAVAVCKKILRLNPSDRRVNAKLARLRAKQGFGNEAANYATAYIDKITGDPGANSEEVKTDLLELAEALQQSPAVLERIADCLAANQHESDAADVLGNLAKHYADRGMTTELEEIRQKIENLGGEVPIVEAPAAPANDAPARGAAPTSAPSDPPAAPVRKGPPPADEKPGKSKVFDIPASAYDYGTIDLGEATASASKSTTATEEMPEQAQEQERKPAVKPPEVTPESPDDVDVDALADGEPEDATSDEEVSRDVMPDVPGAAPSAPEVEQGPAAPQGPTGDKELGDNEVWIPDEELPDSLRSGEGDGAGEVVQVGDIIGQFDAEVTADVDADDYRSHYDLGMAYLEMDLLPEAIREFQFASNSSMYQVSCLEMIGLCFLKQSQPRLAIKQLEKGLSLVGNVDKESIGLQYNLGLAYEMLGDTEQAKLCFEDVYVIDVTFRDIAEKVRKHTS